MEWINRNIRVIMLVSGLMTSSMFFAAIFPQMVLENMFAATLHGPLAELIVRNWGVLIGLMGVMLLYGAYHEPYRRFIVLIVTTSKLLFLLLIVVYGFLQAAMMSVTIDVVVCVLFIAYLQSFRTSS